MSLSQVKVAFQGELGAYSEDAIHQQWPNIAFPVPSRTFAGVISAVTSRKAQYGLLPMENTIIGPIAQSQAALYEAMSSPGTIQLVDDCQVAVQHALIALPNSSLAQIKSIASHPAALSQCTRFLRSHPTIATVEYYDTAGAAQMVALRADPSIAAIASPRAAKMYKLQLLATEIQDMPNNYTRFVIIARHRGHSW